MVLKCTYLVTERTMTLLTTLKLLKKSKKLHYLSILPSRFLSFMGKHTNDITSIIVVVTNVLTSLDHIHGAHYVANSM